MPPKKLDDLLGPLKEDAGADYLRSRLRRRVELERGITMRKAQVTKLLRCLDKTASMERIQTLHSEVLAEISGPVWSLEIEPLLAEMHGEWRYEGRSEVAKGDLERAARHFAISYTMDALLTECGFPVVRTRGERLDDAAWYAIPSSER